MRNDAIIIIVFNICKSHLNLEPWVGGRDTCEEASRLGTTPHCGV